MPLAIHESQTRPYHSERNSAKDNHTLRATMPVKKSTAIAGTGQGMCFQQQILVIVANEWASFLVAYPVHSLEFNTMIPIQSTDFKLGGFCIVMHIFS